MTTPTRTPGRCGRRAPKNARAIRFAEVLRANAVIPPHPASEDYLSRLANWLPLGNLDAGDCVAVTWANFRRLVTAFLSTENYPTQDQVWAVYKTQNPDFDPNGDPNVNGPGSQADGGMDIQTLLEYLVKTGGPDGVKAVAFARVDFTNQAELDAALAIFGGVWTGVTVTQANQQEFADGQAWGYDPNSPVDGGHSVLSGGYRMNDVRFITWGQETDFTWQFVDHQVQEAWVVVWPENCGTAQFQAGIDVAALEAAFTNLTGVAPQWPDVPTPPVPSPTPPPVPIPAPVPPAPTPQPTPDHDPADIALVATLGPWSREHHIAGNERAARAFQVWCVDKGFLTADGVWVHGDGADCWCGPTVSEIGIGHNAHVGGTHELTTDGS